MKNIKIIFVILALVCFTTSFVACSPNSSDEDVYEIDVNSSDDDDDQQVESQGGE